MLKDEKLLLEVISFLRFPLIVAVVLLHTQITTINGVHGDMSSYYPWGGEFLLYEIIIYLFGQILLRVAVPLFFLFSGFLFFYTENFSMNIFVEKLKRRVVTLLIPYLIWNFLFVVCYNFGCVLFPKLGSFIGEGYTIKDWLLLFWNFSGNKPVSWQLWFIRDLIIAIIFSPIIYLLIKKLNFLFPLALLVLWFMNFGFAISAFCFFTLGAYFSITKKNFVRSLEPYKFILGVLYFIFIVIIFCIKKYDFVGYLQRLTILLGMSFSVAFCGFYIKKGIWTVNKFLSNSSFFIYLYHVIAIYISYPIILYVIAVKTDLGAIFLYFFWAFMIVLLGLFFYFFMNKISPRILKMIIGRV